MCEAHRTLSIDDLQGTWVTSDGFEYVVSGYTWRDLNNKHQGTITETNLEFEKNGYFLAKKIDHISFRNHPEDELIWKFGRKTRTWKRQVKKKKKLKSILTVSSLPTKNYPEKMHTCPFVPFPVF